MKKISFIYCKFSKFTILHILVLLVETLPFCTLADPCSSIDVAWIYMVGKGLLAAIGSPACYLAYTGG